MKTEKKNKPLNTFIVCYYNHGTFEVDIINASSEREIQEYLEGFETTHIERLNCNKKGEVFSTRDL